MSNPSIILGSIGIPNEGNDENNSRGEKGGKMSEQEERNLINIEEDIYHSPFTFSFYVNVFFHHHCTN